MGPTDRRSAVFRSQITGDLVRGHASVFGQYAEIRGHLEQIDEHAFDRALKEEHDVRLLINHDPNLLLARTGSGTLRLGIDEVGLTVEADLPDTSYAQDIRASLARGDLDQMSFGFVPTGDEWRSAKGQQIRTITDLDLYDVSLTTFPAYRGTDASLRSIDLSRPSGQRDQLIRIRHRIHLAQGGLNGNVRG